MLQIPSEQPDYLGFVDADIRKMFEGGSYFISDVLMAQLIKELRILNASRPAALSSKQQVAE